MLLQPVDVADLDALASLAPVLASTFVSVASDIAIVVDPSGIVRHVAAAEVAIAAMAAGWIGRAWIDTVTVETRRKIDLMLREVRGAGVARRREVNHDAEPDGEIPIAYAAVQLGEGGPVLAVGRDLRVVAAVQQRYLDAQRTFERDAWQRRQAELRYRLLFQVSTDAVLVLDAATLQVVDVNRAALRLFGETDSRAFDARGLPGLDAPSRQALAELLGGLRTGGRGGSVRLQLAGQEAPVHLGASTLRADGATLIVLRARVPQPPSRPLLPQRRERAADGPPDFVTDLDGRMLAASPALLRLAGLADDRETGERPLAAALGALGGAVGALLERLRAGDPRAAAERVQLELAARRGADDDPSRVGFTLREVEPAPPSGALAVAVEALAAQVGRLALPRLMREATALVERHLLRVAIERAGPDRDAVAAWLEISRESLDLRMRRLGLATDEPGQPPVHRG